MALVQMFRLESRINCLIVELAPREGGRAVTEKNSYFSLTLMVKQSNL